MGFLDSIFGRKSSSNKAKERLQLVLVSDRSNCSPEIMEKIKNDIIEVISRYMEIDTQGLEIKLTQTESESGNGNVPALYANIPVKEMKGSSR